MSEDAQLVASFRASALRQWHAAGGDVLERRAQDSQSALEYAATVREAFVLVQTAAALDVQQLSLLRALRELNGSVEAPAEASPPVVRWPSCSREMDRSWWRFAPCCCWILCASPTPYRSTAPKPLGAVRGSIDARSPCRTKKRPRRWRGAEAKEPPSKGPKLTYCRLRGVAS